MLPEQDQEGSLMARMLDDGVREEQRQRLLDSAIRAIGKSGFDSVRLRDIAADAGVTTGMIQYYFDSRQALLVAALEKVGLDQIDSWTQISELEADPWTRLTRLIAACADPDPERAVERSAAWLEFCSCSCRHAELREMLSAVNQRWREVVVDTIQLGRANGGGDDNAPFERMTGSQASSCSPSVQRMQHPHRSTGRYQEAMQADF